jgi:hypothetical protein
VPEVAPLGAGALEVVPRGGAAGTPVRFAAPRGAGDAAIRCRFGSSEVVASRDTSKADANATSAAPASWTCVAPVTEPAALLGGAVALAASLDGGAHFLPLGSFAYDAPAAVAALPPLAAAGNEAIVLPLLPSRCNVSDDEASCAAAALGIAPALRAAGAAAPRADAPRGVADAPPTPTAVVPAFVPAGESAVVVLHFAEPDEGALPSADLFAAAGAALRCGARALTAAAEEPWTPLAARALNASAVACALPTSPAAFPNRLALAVSLDDGAHWSAGGASVAALNGGAAVLIAPLPRLARAATPYVTAREGAEAVFELDGPLPVSVEGESLRCIFSEGSAFSLRKAAAEAGDITVRCALPLRSAVGAGTR